MSNQIPGSNLKAGDLITLRVDDNGNLVDRNGVMFGGVTSLDVHSCSTPLSLKKVKGLMESGLKSDEIIKMHSLGVI